MTTRPYDDLQYTLCRHCDHFVEPNPSVQLALQKGDDEYARSLADHVHYDNGEQEYDHDATPGEARSLSEWRRERPDLFQQHADGAIGPNSRHHRQRGKLPWGGAD